MIFDLWKLPILELLAKIHYILQELSTFNYGLGQGIESVVNGTNVYIEVKTNPRFCEWIRDYWKYWIIYRNDQEQHTTVNSNLGVTGTSIFVGTWNF